MHDFRFDLFFKNFYISFSSSNTQFYESWISISPIWCCKVFFLFNKMSYIGIFGCILILILNFYLKKCSKNKQNKIFGIRKNWVFDELNEIIIVKLYLNYCTQASFQLFSMKWFTSVLYSIREFYTNIRGGNQWNFNNFVAETEKVLDLIWTPDFLGPQNFGSLEIWSARNLESTKLRFAVCAQQNGQ